ncbi:MULTISPECIES: DUF6328 family protein [Streptomyces]|uniref:Integral membrane protein n=2 Tax=Streptomyces TaxID=1883 RepID=A0A100Y9Q5_9ACTN|nr:MULTISPECIES: DUF6328 family protein [Streptomyces]KUH40352.1 hypothetical protein ATE80_01785 [Streptomyces kanasensis]UUS29802.1 DUF6328 family protein [Streptomyces changanensis]
MTMTEPPVDRGTRTPPACRTGDDSVTRDDVTPDDRPESARDRVNRRWQEILQETRVAQTGVQILFGFLLSVAFTPVFRDLGTFDRAVYVVTVVTGASATAALIAPVSLHRFLSGQRMKDELVGTAHKLMMCGMVLLALTIGCTLLLILHVVVPGLLAELLVGGVMLWFALCWYALPLWLRHRSGRRGDDDPAARG